MTLSRQALPIRLLRAPLRLIPSKLIERRCRRTSLPEKVLARTFWGGEMNVLLPEPLSIQLHRYGFYEPELSQAVLEHVRSGMVFFDVGSHFGYFSLLASHL